MSSSGSPHETSPATPAEAGTDAGAATAVSAGAGAGPAGQIPADLRVAAVFTADLVAVVVFVLLGRASHSEDEALRGILVTLWPFLSGMLVGWLGLLLLRLPPAGYRAAALLVVTTVSIGMALRHAVSHDGTPVSFIIAASTFLTILYLGWRALAQVIRRRRAAS